ncbi:hypothetical protein [Paraburkholderia sp. J7]|uniref:hypothetical protein n=1 Tax=Paraburkholderia sp. J7 TaxID=2805438 RepID=UPI002AB78DD8|nr:hypothetical protein [Paraburkholderia sp. J7]
MLVRISNQDACSAAQAVLRVVYKRPTCHCNNDFLIDQFKKNKSINLKGILYMRRKYTLNFPVYCSKVLTVYLHVSRDEGQAENQAARRLTP